MLKIIIGGQFGDEGKGLVTDWLCAQSPMPLVIRFNGGHQAGHTVVRDGIRHVFSNFGSGTLVGAPTYWSRFCTVDPVGILRELEVLKSKGVNPKLYIDARCPVTTPYEKLANKALEGKLRHGSCGVGFGATIDREEKFYSLTFGDLFHPFIFKAKVQSIHDRHYANLVGAAHVESADLDEFFASCAEIVDSPNVDYVHGLDEIQGRTLIFEGAQGLLLDQHFGIFPHVTRSNTGSANVMELIKEAGLTYETPEFYFVTRAYTTRHGNGPMPNEGAAHNIQDNPLETNKTHEYQGRFRKGLLDIDALMYGLFRDPELRTTKHLNVVVTCLDHLKEYKYTCSGREVSCPDEEQYLNHIVGNIYHTCDNYIKDVYLSHGDYGDQITKRDTCSE